MNNVDFLHGGKVAALAGGQVQSQILGGKRRATVDFTFGGQPTAEDTITINGVVFTFKSSGATGNQINIGGNAEGTIDNAVTVLNASAVAAVAKATYVKSGTTILRATFDEYGAAGNDFTVAENASNVTVASETLLGGLDADTLSLDAETKALVTSAAAGAAQLVEFDLPAGQEGQETTLYLKTKGSSANAQVNGAFASGNTKLTFDTAGKFAKLKWLNSAWYAIANTGTLS